jgi:hypothetical protein
MYQEEVRMGDEGYSNMTRYQMSATILATPQLDEAASPFYKSESA